MSKIFYFIDPEGNFASEDGTIRYRLEKGKRAFQELKEANARNVRFMKCQDGNNEIFIELPLDKYKAHRRQERHEQYINDSSAEYKPLILSLDNEIEVDGEEVVYHDVIASDYDLEAEIFKREEIFLLKKALSALNKEEQDMIQHLFLMEDPFTLREYAKKIGVHFTTVDYRLKKVLEKMKKFF